MAAGLGFKTFTTGEVLTAADTNGYLMQGVLVFASSAARAAAITSPQEGQYSYLKDTNSTEYYDGAAWIAAPIGDITGVTAGVGITGGGTSGTVTVTNDMATTITAAGDIVVGTGSGTYDNLPIGTTAQVLTADTTVSPYKVKWATPASGGGMTLLSTTSTTTGSSYTVSSISSGYNHLQIIWEGLSCTSAAIITLAFAGGDSATGGSTSDSAFVATLASAIRLMPDTQAYGNAIMCNIFNYTAANAKNVQVAYGGVATGWRGGGYQGFHNYSSAISTFTVSISTGSFSAGSLKLYGVK